MDEAGRQHSVMLSPEELDALIETRAAKLMDQRQKSQAERIEHQATSASGGRAEAPHATVPFHRALFRTPPEAAAVNRERGSSSDEVPIRDNRKGKVPPSGRFSRADQPAILRGHLARPSAKALCAPGDR